MISPISSKISFMKNYAVVGHTMPDLDSVCSAIGTAYLAGQIKDKEEDNFTAYAAGNINDETKFALSHFNVEPPIICEDFSLRVSDIIKDKGDKCATLSPKDSIEDFCKLAIEKDLKTLPVVENGRLKGVISRKDLAKFYFKKTKHVSELKEKNIPLSRIAKSLNADVIVGKDKLEEKIKGDVKVGAYSLDTMQSNDYMKDAIVISGDRKDLLLSSIENGAQAIIITRNMNISEDVVEKAKEHGTIILSTEFDVTSSIKSLEQSLPIEDIMTPVKNIVCFGEDDEIEKVKPIMQKFNHDLFPVLKSDGTFLGTINKNNIISPEKKSFILVDHNAGSQYAKGIKEGEIEGIIDHHKIDCRPDGRIDSTFGRTGANATLVYKKFLENDIKIPKNLAGLMWLAIISDTDKFTSSTTTKSDIQAAEKLAQIAEVENKDDVVNKMLATREFDENTPLKQIIESDCKVVPTANGKIFIGQVKTSEPQKYLDKKKQIKSTLNKIDSEKSTEGSFQIISDYLNKRSYIISSDNAIKRLKEHLENADDYELSTVVPDCNATYENVYQAMLNSDVILIKNATSRKEQFQPFMTKIFS